MEEKAITINSITIRTPISHAYQRWTKALIAMRIVTVESVERAIQYESISKTFWERIFEDFEESPLSQEIF